MKKYSYKKIDAFTSGTSKGNPAAYLNLGDSSLTPAQMLEFGREHKGFVCEVVFCENSTDCDRKLTYYSSECEVDFCGHGTIATMYDVIKNDNELSQKEIVTIKTHKKGTLKVYNCIDNENAVYITAPSAQHLDVPVTAKQCACALDICESDFSKKHPLDFIDAGLRTLIVPISTLNKEISIYPDIDILKEFCIKHGIDIILIFSKQTQGDGFIAHTRVFSPKFGYLEDPATGSGNSAFANYMLKYGMWDGTATAVEQGGKSFEYNTVNLKKNGDDILFGGSATVKISGEYFL